MAKKMIFFIIFINLFVGLILTGTSFGAWSLIEDKDWWNETIYDFDDGQTLVIDVDVEIWEDTDAWKYLYGYQVDNKGSGEFSQFAVHPLGEDAILDVGGDLAKDGQGIGSGGSFDWGASYEFPVSYEVDESGSTNYAYYAGARVPSGEKSTIAWFTSKDQPAMGTLTAQGGEDGKVTAPGSPVPEPTTLLLLASGLFGLVGVRGRKYFKK